MSAPITITFQFSDGVSHDASVTEASISQAICYKYGWSIAPTIAGAKPPLTFRDSLTLNSYIFVLLNFTAILLHRKLSNIIVRQHITHTSQLKPAMT